MAEPDLTPKQRHDNRVATAAAQFNRHPTLICPDCYRPAPEVVPIGTGSCACMNHLNGYRAALFSGNARDGHTT